MADAGRHRQQPDPGAAPGRAAGDPSPSAAGDAASPSRFGRYEIRGTLGQGGMGAVLEAWDPELRRTLALKVLSAGGGSSGGQGPVRFLEEAQIGGRLDHPGIAPVHDLGRDDEGRPYFTMRLVEGTTLQDILTRLHDGDDDEWNLVGVLGVLLKVCQAMAYAHAHGVVHRDLKPSNVMVGPYGEVTVMDWGLAHLIEQEDTHDLRPVLPEVTALGEAAAQDSPLLTMEGDVIGTPAFMSPEQALGRVRDLGPATDVYALGAILYHAASGAMPHVEPGESVTAGEVWNRVRSGPPIPLGRRAPQLPPELVAICEKAMAREPDQRYRDMASLSRDLAAYLEGRVVSAHRTGALAEAAKWVARNRPAAVAMTLSLAVVVFGSVTAAIILANLNEETAAARDEAWRSRNEALASLARETAARADAETATRLAEAAAVRESLVRHEAVAAAQREADARRAAEAAEGQARWQAHRANVSAAAAHLSLGDLGAAHAALAACDAELSGWERDVLALRLDPALATWSAGTDVHVRALALSPDGSRVASAGSGGRLHLRDLASGELLADPPLPGFVRDLTFTPDGRRLVLAEGDGSLSQRDATTGALLLRMRGHRGVVRAVAVHPDGQLVISASDDGTVGLWEAGTGEPLAALPHGEPVAALALSPDGDTLASAGTTGGVRLWSLSTRAPAGRLEAEGAVNALAFAPTGERLVTGHDDGRLVTWDWIEGRALASHALGSEVLALAVSADGGRVLAGCADGALRLGALHAGSAPAVVGGHRAAVHDVGFGSGDALLLSASADGTLRLWDGATREGPARLDGHLERATCAELSADGALLASGSSDRTVRLLDGRSGDLLHVLEGHASSIMSLAFAAGGARLASSDYDGRVQLWDTASGELLVTLERGTGRIATVTASPDGRLLASARGGRGNSAYAGGRLLQPLAGEREVILWDGETGREVGRVAGQEYGTTVAAFSGDGARLATGSQAGGLALWDVASGARLATLAEEPRAGQEPDLPPVSFLAVDPTGRTVVSAHLSRLLPLVVWDAGSGERLAVLQGHDTRVWAARLTPDGRRVLSSGEDGSVRIWDVATGEHLLTLAEPGLTGLWLAMDGAGRRLVAPTHDGSIVVWDADVDAARGLWQGAARRDAVRSLADRLLDEHVLPERALTALAAGEVDAGELHDALAARLASTPSPTTSTLNREAWDVVRAPGADPAAYAGALVRAELAVARSPERAALLNTLGLACHRAGQHERALDLATRADELNRAGGTRYPRATDLVVMALALASLDRGDEARAALHQAATSLAEVTDPELLDLAAEAEALLADKET